MMIANNNTQAIPVRRLLADCGFEAYNKLQPLVQKWVIFEERNQRQLLETGTPIITTDEQNSDDDETENFYRAARGDLNFPFTLSNIIRLCDYRMDHRARLYKNIVDGFAELGRSSTIRVRAGTSRWSRSEIWFKNLTAFLFAFQFIKNKIANQVKLLQASITSFVLTRIATIARENERVLAAQVAQLTLENENLDEENTELQDENTELQALTAQVVNETSQGFWAHCKNWLKSNGYTAPAFAPNNNNTNLLKQLRLDVRATLSTSPPWLYLDDAAKAHVLTLLQNLQFN